MGHTHILFIATNKTPDRVTEIDTLIHSPFMIDSEVDNFSIHISTICSVGDQSILSHQFGQLIDFFEWFVRIKIFFLYQILQNVSDYRVSDAVFVLLSLESPSHVLFGIEN